MRTFLYKIKLYGLHLIRFFGQLLHKIVLKNKGKRIDITLSNELDQISLNTSLDTKDTNSVTNECVDIKINIEED